MDSTRCLEDSTREILAHIDTASSLAADLKLCIHDANLPVQEIERCSIEVRPHNWGGIHCCVQDLRRVELCEMTRCPARSKEQGELLQLESGFLFKTPRSLKFIMKLPLLHLKLERRPIPAHLIKYQKGDGRHRCEAQRLCFAERQIPMSESSSRPSR